MKFRLPLCLALALACATPAFALSPDVERANALLDAGKVQEAVSALETAIARDQNDVEALIALSRIYTDAEMPQAALAQAEAAVRAAPENSDALLLRAMAYYDVGERKKARADLEAVLARGPNAPALLQRGLLNSVEGDKVAGLADLRAAYALDPSEPAYPYMIGIALNDLDRPEEALATFEMALSISPGNEEIGRERAATLYRLERFQESVDAYKTLLKSHPDQNGIRVALASAYQAAGDNDRALAGYTEVTRRDPTSMIAWWNRAEILAATGKTKEALKSYDRAVLLDPANAELVAGRGLTRYDAGDTGQALADLNAAIKIDPKSAMALAYRGHVLSGEGQHEKAISDYDASIAIDPANAFALVSRAESQFELGKNDRALRDLAEAIKIAPQSGLYRFQGQIYATLGDHISATEAFDQAIKLDPQDAQALLRRSRSKLELGDKAGADLDRAQALKLNPKVEAQTA